MAGFNPYNVIGGAGLAGLGLLGNVLQSTSNDALQRQNNQRIEQLRKLQRGAGFGLNPVEEQQLQQQLVSPVQKAAAEGRLRAEQMAAASGNATGGQLATLRQEQAAQTGAGVQAATMQVRAADQAKKRAQEQQLDQRIAAQASMRADDLQTILQGAAESAAAGGAIAGAPPGTLPQTLTGFAGLPWSQRTAAAPALQGLDPALQKQLAAMDPAMLTKLLQRALQMQDPGASRVVTGSFLAPSGRVEP